MINQIHPVRNNFQTAKPSFGMAYRTADIEYDGDKFLLFQDPNDFSFFKK